MSDPMVEALRSLCTKEGGYKEVALHAGHNDQSVYQITAGILLPSGKPRGVGRLLRERLNKAYPGWLDREPSISKPTTAPPSAPSADMAYIAEKTANFSRPKMNQLLAVVDWLAGEHGDAMTINFSIAPRADVPTAAPAAAPETDSAARRGRPS